MLQEGYAAVTSRRVAASAGLKPQLVHYYFRTMDDLFLALFRRRAEQGLERQAQALASPQPLWALWDLSRDPRGTALTMEFVALANHRKAIRTEIASSAERFRADQLRGLEPVLAAYGIAEACPPLVFTVLAVERLALPRHRERDAGHDDRPCRHGRVCGGVPDAPRRSASGGFHTGVDRRLRKY